MAPTISTSQLSYTLAGLVAPQPHRLDGRSLLAFRPLHLTTGIAPQAAGSALASLGGTRCTVVVSAEVVQDDEAADTSSLLSSSVECAAAVPSSTSMAALLVTLQKALDNALHAGSAADSGIDPSQLVILRSIQPPHLPTRAWRLHVDVEFNDVRGGNLADVMFSAVYAALNDVRLPRTRAIGYDIAMMFGGQDGTDANAQQATADGTSKATLDIFDTKRSQSRGKAAAGARHRHNKMATGEGSSAPNESTASSIGVDFEMEDQWDMGVSLAGAASFPVGITLNLLPANRTLLDATLTEEACLPTSRRVLVLCRPNTSTASPASSFIAGTYTLSATLDVGTSRTGESDDDGHAGDASKGATSRPFYGTCAYSAITTAIREGYTHALGLHAAIQAQIGAESTKA